MDRDFIVKKLKSNILECHKCGTPGKTVILIQISYYFKNKLITKDEYTELTHLLDNKGYLPDNSLVS